MKKLLALAFLLTTLLNANASYYTNQVGIPPVLATNTSSGLFFTNAVTLTTVTNADGTIFTNVSSAIFIDARGAQNVGFEFHLTSSTAGSTAAGVTNAIYTLVPTVIYNANSPNQIYIFSNNISQWVTVPAYQGGLIYDTNHPITLTVPLSAVPSLPNVWTTNLNAQGLAGWFLIETQNQAKNNLITNVLYVSQKNNAP